MFTKYEVCTPLIINHSQETLGLTHWTRTHKQAARGPGDAPSNSLSSPNCVYGKLHHPSYRLVKLICKQATYYRHVFTKYEVCTPLIINHSQETLGLTHWTRTHKQAARGPGDAPSNSLSSPNCVYGKLHHPSYRLVKLICKQAT